MDNIELINLSLNEIGKIATTIDRTNLSLECSPYDSLKERVKITEDSLNELRLKLRDCLEYIANVANAHDILSETDISSTREIYDLIYGRITENDE